MKDDSYFCLLCWKKYAYALNRLSRGWEFSNILFFSNVKIDKTNDIYF